MAVTESSHLASQEIDELYRRYGSDVYRYAFAVLGNHADAEDVTQTTFLNAYRAIEQGVRPRKPANWLLTIASNAIKQRFRQEQARPRYVELDDRTARADLDEADGPTVGELLAALSKIPPQQRQAIVLREFEGRSYAEIADILGVTTSALETMLFRARRSLAEELEHQLSCTEAQLAVSRAADGRLGRKERRRLRDHLAECPDCSHFARMQQRHRRALKGLVLLPVPLSLSFLKGIEGTASAATLPAGAGAAAVGGGVGAGASAVAVGTGLGSGTSAGGGLLAGGIAAKAAAVVAAATVAGGVVVTGASESGSRGKDTGLPGARIGQVAPRGVLVPGNGVALGKAHAPGQAERAEKARESAARRHGTVHPVPKTGTRRGKSASAHTRARGGSAATNSKARGRPPESASGVVSKQPKPTNEPGLKADTTSLGTTGGSPTYTTRGGLSNPRGGRGGPKAR